MRPGTFLDGLLTVEETASDRLSRLKLAARGFRDRRRADRTCSAAWAGVQSYPELRRLNARFIRGYLPWSPTHCGPPDKETERIIEPLVHANRVGFLTVCSQPGEYTAYSDGGSHQQRAFVDGYVPDELHPQIQGLLLTGRFPSIQMWSARPRRWNYLQVGDEVVTRMLDPDGNMIIFTGIGLIPPVRWLRGSCSYGRLVPGEVLDEIEWGWYVILYDESWGDRPDLWNLLRELR